MSIPLLGDVLSAAKTDDERIAFIVLDRMHHVPHGHSALLRHGYLYCVFDDGSSLTREAQIEYARVLKELRVPTNPNSHYRFGDPEEKQ